MSMYLTFSFYVALNSDTLSLRACGGVCLEVHCEVLIINFDDNALVLCLLGLLQLHISYFVKTACDAVVNVLPFHKFEDIVCLDFLFLNQPNALDQVFNLISSFYHISADSLNFHQGFLLVQVNDNIQPLLQLIQFPVLLLIKVSDALVVIGVGMLLLGNQILYPGDGAFHAAYIATTDLENCRLRFLLQKQGFLFGGSLLWKAKKG